MQNQVLTESSGRRHISTPVLVAIILLAPIALGLFQDTPSETIVFAMVMVSGPILIGLYAQRKKHRTGAVWWFLSTILMMIAYVLGGGGDWAARLASAVVFGAIPIAIIVSTLPNRVEH